MTLMRRSEQTTQYASDTRTTLAHPIHGGKLVTVAVAVAVAIARGCDEKRISKQLLLSIIY